MSDVKFNNCNDRMAILRNELVPRKLKDIDEITTIEDADYVYINRDREAKKIKAGLLRNESGIQSNWKESEPTSLAFILNKPGCDDLEEDKVVLYNIGGIKAGHVFEKGTTVREIIDMMLSFNDRGYMIAKIINVNPGDTEEFTLADMRAIDADLANHIDVTGDILINGYNWDAEMDNNYFIIAVKEQSGKQVEVEEITQAGFKVALSTREFNQGEFKIWYFNQPSKGKFNFNVKVR